VTASRTISVRDLRRHLVAAQGYAARFRQGRPREVEEMVNMLSAVQLDSISAVERSHRLALTSRVGRYPRGTVSQLLARGRLFEYWAHEACLLPIADWPLHRHRMVASAGAHPWWGNLIDREPALADQVLGSIRERGALGSRHFEGKGGSGMWSLKPAKRMLEALWSSGQLVVAGRQGFQRLYDLPERVIPDEYLEAPVPSQDEYLRRLCLRAVTARGALTAAGVVEHWRLRGGVARLRPHLDALVADGLLERLTVDDGGPPVLLPAGAREPALPSGSTFISPFDNLLWDRPFARRILGFDHLIAVYKPQSERRYGYYVLPLVDRDRIIGRADLRADRPAGRLIMLAYHPERGRRSTAPAERALERLARVLELAPAIA
jgi:uncharacterized protein